MPSFHRFKVAEGILQRCLLPGSRTLHRLPGQHSNMQSGTVDQEGKTTPSRDTLPKGQPAENSLHVQRSRLTVSRRSLAKKADMTPEISLPGLHMKGKERPTKNRRQSSNMKHHSNLARGGEHQLEIETLKSRLAQACLVDNLQLLTRYYLRRSRIRASQQGFGLRVLQMLVTILLSRFVSLESTPATRPHTKCSAS